MSEEKFTAGAEGMRLDGFLASRLSGCSRTYCKELVQAGKVTVDGKKRDAKHRLEGGEIVLVLRGGAAWETPSFEDWVLHEDRDIIVFHKPSGIITHPMGETWLRHPEAALDDKEASVANLLWKFRPAVRTPEVSRCGIVHRLDRQTSGVMVAAKSAAAQTAMLKGFRERTVAKVYRAIVLGHLEKTKVDAPIGRIPGRRKVQVTPWGKEASTLFKTVESAGGMSIVSAEPKTGRTHQIRAHLALLGYPVAGDHDWFKETAQAALARLRHEPPSRMMLHAYRIRFAHPASGKKVAFTAALPKDFRDYWNSIKAR